MTCGAGGATGTVIPGFDWYGNAAPGVLLCCVARLGEAAFDAWAIFMPALGAAAGADVAGGAVAAVDGPLAAPAAGAAPAAVVGPLAAPAAVAFAVLVPGADFAVPP